MANITYFLGAGASYEYVPIVQTISTKIDEVRNKIAGRTFGGRNIFIPPTLDVDFAKKELLKSLEWLAKEASNHNTIDTYAKKLFLLGDKKKLNELKATLTICFYFWQFFDVPAERAPTPNVDPRYISLMSSFLQKDAKGNIVLPSNVNFITWNYDLQLELTLKYFDEFTDSIMGIQRKFKSYPNEDLEKYSSAPKIIHLNGIAGLYTSGNFTGISMDNLKPGKNDYWDTVVIEMLLLYDLLVLRKQVGNNHVFTFAWEGQPVSTLGIQSAIDIMEQTDYLVVIGYSFPVFNREIDRRLFSNKAVNKFGKVYYQDKNPDSIALASTFGIQRNKIHEFTNVKQFTLPFEF